MSYRHRFLKDGTRRPFGTPQKANNKIKVMCSMQGINLRLHEVVWFYHNGEWPDGTIIHNDGNALNNHISNLRVGDLSEIKQINGGLPQLSVAEMTGDIVREYLDYNEEGGLLWRNTGKRYGWDRYDARAKGYYRYGRFCGRDWGEHRLVYLWHHNELPNMVDHIDRNGLNNKIENLRPVTINQNNWNRRSNRGGTSEYKGVSFWQSSKKWHTVLMKNGARYYGGQHETEEAAARAYDQLAIEHHGEHAVLNLPTEYEQPLVLVGWDWEE